MKALTSEQKQKLVAAGANPDEYFFDEAKNQFVPREAAGELSPADSVNQAASAFARSALRVGPDMYKTQGDFARMFKDLPGIGPIAERYGDSLYNIGQTVQEQGIERLFPQDVRAKGTWLQDILPSAAGTIVPSAFTGLAGGLAAGGRAALRVMPSVAAALRIKDAAKAGKIGAMAVGGLMEGREALDEEKERQAALGIDRPGLAMGKGLAQGAIASGIEAIGGGKIAEKVADRVAGALTKKGVLKSGLSQGLRGVVEDPAQETTKELLVHSRLPTAEQALVSAIAGGIVQGGVGSALDVGTPRKSPYAGVSQGAPGQTGSAMDKARAMFGGETVAEPPVLQQASVEQPADTIKPFDIQSPLTDQEAQAISAAETWEVPKAGATPFDRVISKLKADEFRLSEAEVRQIFNAINAQPDPKLGEKAGYQEAAKIARERNIQEALRPKTAQETADILAQQEAEQDKQFNEKLKGLQAQRGPVIQQLKQLESAPAGAQWPLRQTLFDRLSRIDKQIEALWTEKLNASRGPEPLQLPQQAGGWPQGFPNIAGRLTDAPIEAEIVGQESGPVPGGLPAGNLPASLQAPPQPAGLLGAGESQLQGPAIPMPYSAESAESLRRDVRSRPMNPARARVLAEYAEQLGFNPQELSPELLQTLQDYARQMGLRSLEGEQSGPFEEGSEYHSGLPIGKAVKRFVQALQESQARIVYGLREETAKEKSYVLTWSNGQARWSVSRGGAYRNDLGPLPDMYDPEFYKKRNAWREKYGRLRDSAFVSKGGRVKLDANNILISADSMAEAQKIADHLPPLPLYAASSEARSDEKISGETTAKWLAAKSSPNSSLAKELRAVFGDAANLPSTDQQKYIDAFIDDVQGSAPTLHSGLPLNFRLISNDEAQKAAWTQRAEPESVMNEQVMKLVRAGHSGNFVYFLEHLGDLSHRAQEHDGIGMGGFAEKLERLNRALNPPKGQDSLERELHNDIVSNADYAVLSKLFGDDYRSRTFEEREKAKTLHKRDILLKRADLREQQKIAGEVFAVAHEKYNKPVTLLGRLGKQIAIQFGRQDFDGLRQTTKKINAVFNRYKQAQNPESVRLFSGSAETLHSGLPINLRRWNLGVDTPMVTGEERQKNERKFMEGSAVVDKQGRPLELFHTTKSGDIEVFDIDRNPQELGPHFGTYDTVARLGSRAHWTARPFSWTPKSSSEIPTRPDWMDYPVILSIKNPIRLPDMFPLNRKNLLANPGLISEVDKVVKDPKALAVVRKHIDHTIDGTLDVKEFRKDLMDLGYDGAVYDNKAEGGGDSWIAFKDSQIKSRTGNKGTYGENPSILHSGLDLRPVVKALQKVLGDKVQVNSIEDVDNAYLEAVKKGDMETAQKMVDEAAKAAGYNVGPVWHGTTADKINAFRKKLSGIWVANDIRGAKPGSGAAAKTTLRLFVDPRKVDHTLTPEEYAAWRKTTNPLSFIRSVRDRTRANTIRVGDYATVVFDPSQIKSADPVTFDDAGQPIPLSQRFNQSKPSIYYSGLPVNLDPLALLHRVTRDRITALTMDSPDKAYAAFVFSDRMLPDAQEIENTFVAAVQELGPLDKETTAKAHENDRLGVENYDGLNETQAARLKGYYDIYEMIGQLAKRYNMWIKDAHTGQRRPLEIKRGRLPRALSQEVLDDINEGGEREQQRRDEFMRHQQALHGNNPRWKEIAQEKYDNYSPNMLYGGRGTSPRFGALEFSEGDPLPPGWETPDIAQSLGRYIFRASRAISWAKNVQNDPFMRRMLQINEDSQGRVVGKDIPENPSDFSAMSVEDKANIIRAGEHLKAPWTKRFTNASEIRPFSGRDSLSVQSILADYRKAPVGGYSRGAKALDAAGQLAGSIIMQTGTGMRDYGTSYANTVARLPAKHAAKISAGYLNAIAHPFKTIAEAKQAGAMPVDSMVAEAAGRGLTRARDAAKDFLREAFRNFPRAMTNLTFATAKTLRKATGRELLDELSKAKPYSLVYSIVLNDLEVAGRSDLFDQYGDLAAKTNEDKAKSAARKFVDRVQPSYDFRSLPPNMLPSQKHYIGYMAGLMRWSVSQYNKFYQDIWQPAVRSGKIGKLLKTILVGSIVGPAADELIRFFSGKRPKDLSIGEWFNLPDEKKWDEFAPMFFAYHQMIGTFGGLGDGLYQASRFAANKPLAMPDISPQQSLLLVGTDVFLTLVNFSKAAMENGSLSPQDWGELGLELASMMQNVRMLTGAADEDRDIKRDRRMFQELYQTSPLTGEYAKPPSGVMAKITRNPWSMNERLKRADTAAEFRNLLPSLLEESIKSGRALPQRNELMHPSYYIELANRRGREEARRQLMRDIEAQQKVEQRKVLLKSLVP